MRRKSYPELAYLINVSLYHPYGGPRLLTASTPNGSFWFSEHLDNPAGNNGTCSYLLSSL
jgi:hypothetical protein